MGLSFDAVYSFIFSQEKRFLNKRNQIPYQFGSTNQDDSFVKEVGNYFSEDLCAFGGIF